MLFAFKKTLSAFLLPLPIVIILLTIGVLLLWFNRAANTRLILITSSLLILFIFTLNPLPTFLLNNLENRFPALNTLPHNINYIVVLSSTARVAKNRPANAQLDASSLARLIEAIRLYQQNPNVKLILSGGNYFKGPKVANLLQQTAVELGVNPERIIIENHAIDTAQEAKYVKKIIANTPFVLVTSAYHMPRAMALFQNLGLKPIADPTQFLTPVDQTRLRNYLPSTLNLSRSNIAIHEYLGMLWSKLRQQI